VFNEVGNPTIANLKETTFVFPTVYPLFAQSIIEDCADCGYVPNIRYHAGSTFGDVFIPKDDDEVFAISESSKSRVLPCEISNLVDIGLNDPQATLRIVAIYRQDGSVNPAIEKLRKLLISVAQKIKANALEKELPAKTGITPLVTL
jgi:hypothetical protein